MWIFLVLHYLALVHYHWKTEDGGFRLAGCGNSSMRFSVFQHVVEMDGSWRSYITLLQSSQASSEHPVVHCTSGLTEAYWLLSQITVRWRPTWSVPASLCYGYDQELTMHKLFAQMLPSVDNSGIGQGGHLFPKVSLSENQNVVRFSSKMWNVVLKVPHFDGI